MRRALLNICISELSRFLYIFNATQTKRGDKCGCAPHVWLRYVIIFVIFMRKLDKVAVGTPYYDHTLNYSLCRRYTMLGTPSNVGGLIVRRIVWPIFNPRTTDVEHPTFTLDHVPDVVRILDRVKGLLPNV
jgi:hypothetical protein